MVAIIVSELGAFIKITYSNFIVHKNVLKDLLLLSFHNKLRCFVFFQQAVVSLLSSLVSWLLQHYVLVIIGTVAVLGLCAVTSIFSAEPVYEIDHVVRAVRSVDQGILQFSRLI